MCQPSHRTDGTLVSSGAPPNCDSALHCPLPGVLCNGTSLASVCSVTSNAKETTQGETMRGRNAHYIPFSCSFSIKSRNLVKTKSNMCRRHFSGEAINTSHKHLWMDESHEKDSQYNQFSHKRNLTPQHWCIWETGKTYLLMLKEVTCLSSPQVGNMYLRICII